MNKLISAAIVAAYMLPMNLYAESSHHGDHHKQEAHLHGLGEITLALEGDNIELNLESPAANIVGFEHRASTPDQRQRVNEAKATLESPKQLFTFSGTRCELTALEVDVSAVQATEESEHKENKHDHHDHSDHEKANHKTHSEVSANYRFQCDDGSRLAAITFNFFEHFPGTEKLDVEWVTDSNQGSAELTVKSKTIYLGESHEQRTKHY